MEEAIETTEKKFAFSFTLDEYSDIFAALLFSAEMLEVDDNAHERVQAMRALALKLNKHYVNQGGPVERIATAEDIRRIFGI